MPYTAILSHNDNVTMIFLPGKHLLIAKTLHLQNVTNVVFTTSTKHNDVEILIGIDSGLMLERILSINIQLITIIFNSIEDAAVFKEVNLFRLEQVNITDTQRENSPPASPSISNIRYIEISESAFWQCVLALGKEYNSSFETVSLVLKSVLISEVKFQSFNSTVNITVDQGTYLLNFTDSHIANKNSGIHIKVHNSKLAISMRKVHITDTNGIGLKIEDLSNTQSDNDITLDATSCRFESNIDGIMVNTLAEISSMLTLMLEKCYFQSKRHGIVINSNVNTHLDISIRLSQFTTNKNAIMLQNQEKNSTRAALNLVIVLSHCNFTHNVNSVIVHKSQITKMKMMVEFCNFTDNTGISMLVDATSKEVNEEGSTLRMRNCTFVKNTELLQGISIAVVQLHGYIEATLSNCSFHENRNTAIEIEFGNLVFAENNTFVSNHGNYGGAISLMYSQIIFTVNANVYFTKNCATSSGGAIFVTKKPSPSKYAPCFYSVAEKSQVHFIDNVANNGGDAIYGAGLNDTCIANEQTNSSSVSIYRNHFKFSQNNSRLSLVTSDPKRICLCYSDNDTQTPMCADIDYIFHTATMEAYPGEYFVFYIALVGCEFGTVAGTAYIKTVGGNYIQTVAIASKTCTAVNFTINSEANTTITLVLTTEALSLREYGDRDDEVAAIKRYNKTDVIPKTLLTTPVYIEIKVSNCPRGFTSNDSRCECDKKVYPPCIICNTQRLFKVRGMQWVGKDNNSDEVLYTEHAPHGHVNDIVQWVSLDGVGKACPAINGEAVDIVEQCANNHAGQLCGSCKDSYSLTLGRPQCELCSDNTHMSLLVLFILAGPFLVALIKLLNLTVTSGSVNGLIIYANLVWANERIIFNSEECKFNEYFLKVFIAWLNLDFGFTTCFFDGFDSVWKAFLQFLFPIYIWILVLAIKIASDYSSRVARVFGTNSVCILATLFLLSYSKLLTAVTTVFDITNLGSITVWTNDGTIEYLSGVHIGLFIVALAFSLFFLFPFTASLLFIQCLRGVSHITPFKWVDKQKPYFDAYTGILEDKHHYWVGLLLLARGAMLITTAITENKRYDLIVLGIISAMLSLHTGVYKKWYLNLIEKSFLLNLNLFATALLAIYVQTGFDKNIVGLGNIVTSVFVGISFVQFVGIIILQAMMQLYRMYGRQPEEEEDIWLLRTNRQEES